MAGRFSIESVFKAVDKVTAPVSRMQRNVLRFTRKTEGGLRKVSRAISAVSGGLARAGKFTFKAGGAAIGGLTSAVTFLMREFSKVEDAEAAFTPLLGGAERARRAVEAINETAATTPFKFETLAGSVKHLLPVMDGSIQDTIKTVRMLGDTAGGNAQNLESITRGFTKAMLKGKPDMKSLNMIAKAGVPVFTELAEAMGTKVNPAFFKMILAGRVTTKDLIKAFKRMTAEGGKFYKGMDIASKTTTQLWSILEDNVSFTAAELGRVLAPTIKDLIKLATEYVRKIRDWLKVDENRKNIVNQFNKIVERVKVTIKGWIEQVQELNKQHNLLSHITDIILGISDAFKFLRKHGDTVLKIITGVMAAFTLAMMANPIGLIAIGVIAVIAAFTALWVWVDEIAEKFDAMPFIFKVAFAPIYALVRVIQWLKNNMGSIVDTAGAVADKVGSFGNWVGDFFGGDDVKQTPGQVVSPQERTSKLIEERRSSAEVTIKDETGRASVTRGELGSGVLLQPTGAL